MAAIFSRGFDAKVRNAAVGLTLGTILFVGGFYYYAYPQYTRVGYQPEQPVPFSHQLHVGQVGMDCRYCHQHVEDSKHASIPNTQVCMNCHNGVDAGKANVKANSPLLSQLRESWKSNNPVEWRRVHKLPEFAFFDHSIHVNRGVSCFNCHGQINEMKVVYHAKSLTMGWCLDCHHHLDEALRPRTQVFNPLWNGDGGKSKQEVSNDLKKILGVNPPSHCGGCHR
ncbi:MAG: cytochrome c family protein [Planctomycetes bacterium]|nr:cytochrome c family protein [Planctomycetota bacterium]